MTTDRAATPIAPVVGFDLDMTLVDSRPGIGYCLEQLAAETGRPLDVASVLADMGPPIQHHLVRWFAADEVPAALAAFRACMATEGVRRCTVLPGAHDALAAVAGMGGTSLVVTGKHQPLADATVREMRLRPDSVVGDVWAEEKAVALLAAGAAHYVGDHPADVRAARAARATAVMVTSGPATREQLVAAGADVVLDSLAAFPQWLRGSLSPAT
jgi:phosphoglycolate phosphatase